MDSPWGSDGGGAGHGGRPGIRGSCYLKQNGSSRSLQIATGGGGTGGGFKISWKKYKKKVFNFNIFIFSC